MKDPHPPQKHGTLLVTGCPRSGTRSVSLYFKDRGLDIGHEMRGRNGTVEWRNAYIGDTLDFDIMMVAVRDPVRTTISLNHLITGALKRPCITQEYIHRLSQQGGWEDELLEGRYFDAAVKWWTSVYEYLWGYPTIFVDRSGLIPHSNPHIGRAEFTPSINLDEFYRVAALYGYRY